MLACPAWYMLAALAALPTYFCVCVYVCLRVRHVF